jgi:hypothetical protein
MDELGFPIDHNPGRWLVGAAGGVLSEAGVQAMLTSQTTPLTYTAPLTALGVILILLAVFWKKVRFDRTAFADRLNKLGSDPRVWITFVAAVWLGATGLSIVKEIRRNNEIVTLRNDDLAIAKVIDRIVLPRHLSKRQQRVISTFLLQFEPHEYAFVILNGDEECDGYREDIEQALMKGGWTRAATKPYTYTNDLPVGLVVKFAETQEHTQKGYDPRNPADASMLLQEAFGLGAVPISAGSNSGQGITEERLVISIGRPKRSSYVLALPDDY